MAPLALPALGVSADWRAALGGTLANATEAEESSEASTSF